MYVIGTKIKQLRLTYKMTQQELSKILDISQSNLSEIENNNTIPTLSLALKAAQHFNVSLDWLTDNNHIIEAPILSEEELLLISLYNSLMPLDRQEVFTYIQFRKTLSDN